jgi:hypothetical protein
MENREQQILSEIKTMMASIRIQLEKLDAKMAELQQVVDPEDMTAVPIDLDIDDMDVTQISEEVVEEDDLPFVETPVEAPVEAPVETPVEAPAEAPVVEAVIEEPVVEETVEEAAVEEDDDDDLPLFAEPKPIFEAAQESPKVKKAVIDVMTNKEAWRTDMAGSPVRDLLSAISLNDRVQFINVLFDEDPVKFQQTRAKINAMTSLDDVVAFITENFSWDMSSPVVYRFMMAVRRKVQG